MLHMQLLTIKISYDFMRNVTMCAMILLLMANVSIGQDKNTYEKLTVKIYDQKNEIISNTVLENEEARNVNIPSFLLENQDVARITLRGLFYNDKEVNSFSFDSYDLPEFAEAENLCEQVDFTMKPFFGVGVYSTDDMRGVTIERIVEDGPAQTAGLHEGDIIISFNAIPVSSHCDLKLEVAECEVGQVVPVQLEKDGKLHTEYVTIGGQINNKIGFKVCDEPKADLSIESSSDDSSINLSVYPNPTNGATNLKFLSSSAEQIKFYVMDINGGIVHKEVQPAFNGGLNLDYTFGNEAAGTYLFVIEQGDKLYKQKVIYSKK